MVLIVLIGLILVGACVFVGVKLVNTFIETWLNRKYGADSKEIYRKDWSLSFMDIEACFGAVLAYLAFVCISVLTGDMSEEDIRMYMGFGFLGLIAEAVIVLIIFLKTRKIKEWFELQAECRRFTPAPKPAPEPVPAADSRELARKRKDIADILDCYTQLGRVRKKQCAEQIEIIRGKYRTPRSDLGLKVRYGLRQAFNVFLTAEDLGQFADYESYKRYAGRHGGLPDSGLTYEGRVKLEVYKAVSEEEDRRMETYDRVLRAVNGSEETALKTWQAAYTVRDDGNIWFIMHSIVTGSGVKPSYDVNAGAFTGHETSSVDTATKPMVDRLREILSGLGSDREDPE